MSATVIDPASESFTSGIPREQLRRITWAEVLGLRGVFRMQVLRDLERYDIRPDVRVNLEALQSFRPGATSLDPQLGEAWDYVLDGEWQSVRLDFAVSLYHRAAEDPTLGAPTMREQIVDDGLGGKFYNPAPVAGVRLFEFRFPAERLVVKGK